MKKILVPISVLCLLASSCSTTKNTQVKTADISKYMNSITANELSDHLYIVASDAMEGRDTGTKGQKEAGKYLIEQYTKNGISFPTGAENWYQKVPSEFMAQ
ncbi:MAG: peptidase M28, partial [Flavobacterium sp.]